MSTLVSIRKYRPGDEFYCQEIIHDAIMSILWPTFMNGVTREITFDVILLTLALMFIFFGFSFGACLAAVPCILVAIFCGVWISLKMKAAELRQTLHNVQRYYMRESDSCLWVAEAFENRGKSPLYSKFTVIPEEMIRDWEVETVKCRKRVVGLAAIKRERDSEEPTANLHHIAVSPKYQGKGIGTVLIQKAIQFCQGNNYSSISIKITECHPTSKQLYTKLGFELVEIHQQEIIGQLVTMTIFELKYSLKKHPSSPFEIL